jgi:hypothetical protein
MSVSSNNEQARKDAKKKCRLNDEEIAMARELGFQPKSLIRNIPSPSQQWKAPVKEWIRSLHEEEFGVRASRRPEPAAEPSATASDVPSPDTPWPDRPEIPEIINYGWRTGRPCISARPGRAIGQ